MSRSTRFSFAAHTCATKSVPAGEIEHFVVGQIEEAGRDPAVLEGTLRQMRQQQRRPAQGPHPLLLLPLSDAAHLQREAGRSGTRCVGMHG